MEFFGNNVSAGGNLARIVAEDQDNSLLGNLGRFLGRPGYALRSLLRGDVVDAGENLAQMAMDLPTGGFLNRNLSLANLVSETGDITDKSERPEFSDLINYSGRGLDRLALDVVGGMATDPLTFLTFGGGGLAKGSLAGATRTDAASRIGLALGKTSEGAKALSAAADDVARGMAIPGVSKLDDLLGMTDEAARAVGLSGRSGALGLARTAKDGGVERVFAQALGDDAFRFSGNMAQASVLDDGIEALEASGKIWRNDAIRVGLPFGDPTKAAQLDWTAGFWKKLGAYGTAPGLFFQGLKKASPSAADVVRGEAVELWDKVRKFYDVTLDSRVAQGLQDAAKKSAINKTVRTNNLGKKVAQSFAGFDDAEKAARGLGELVAEHEDLLTLYRGDGALEAVNRRIDDLSRAARGAGGSPLDNFFATVNPTTSLPPGASREVDALRKLARHIESGADLAATSDEAIEFLRESFRARALSEFGENGLKAADAYMDEMVSMQRSLFKEGVFSTEVKNPFYLPHQIEPELLEKFKAIDGLSDVRDAFTKGRAYGTSAEFLDALKDIAGKKGINVEDMLTQDLDLRRLWFERGASHIRTQETRRLLERAQKDFGLEKIRRGDGSPGWADSHVKTYLEGVLAKTRPDSKLFRAFAGGKQRTLLDADGLARWKERLGGIGEADAAGNRIVKRGDQFYLEQSTKGLNYYIKPTLTSMNPGFHVRNWLSAGVMRFFDPDNGTFDSWRDLSQAFSDFWAAAPQFPVLSQLSSAFGKNSEELATLLRAAKQGDEASMAAAKALTVGAHAGDEVAEGLRALIGQNQTDLARDLLDDTMRAVMEGEEAARKVFTLDKKKSLLNFKEIAAKAADKKRGPAGAVYDEAVRLGEVIANHVEDTSRAGLYMQLLKKGVTPADAVKRVNKVMVDYAMQGQAEAWARQIIPFARFAIGSSAWLGEFARRPRLLTPLTTVRNASEAQRDEGEVLPESVRESVSLPVGKDALGRMRYITGLGLPQEAALSALGTIASPTGARRSVLGGLHPMLKLPAEAVTNRDFFFGGEFGEYRKAPAVAARLGFGSKIDLPDGRERYEWPGAVREVMDALPFTRQFKTFDRFFDAEKDKIGSTVQTLTGLRMQSIDQERELKDAIYGWLKEAAKDGRVGEFNNWVSRFDAEDTPEDLKIVLQGLRDLRKKRADEKKRKRQ